MAFLPCPVGVDTKYASSSPYWTGIDHAELLLSRTDAEQGRKACLEIASFPLLSYLFHILYYLQFKSFSLLLLFLQPITSA